MAIDELNQPFTKAEMEAMRRSARDENRLLAEAFALLKRVARRIPFAEDALALYYCARDPMTETRVKLIVLAALAYLVLPLDTIPDMLPLMGFADDAAVIAAAIAAVRGAISDLHRRKARDTLAGF
ncbi:MAG TPA: YkvA family protein [Beijerinckiaceae bacterium]|mgnify:CR=1 FL=1|nr:YkvA family protein [Beijerinckiaceae bacterium]